MQSKKCKSQQNFYHIYYMHNLYINQQKSTVKNFINKGDQQKSINEEINFIKEKISLKKQFYFDMLRRLMRCGAMRNNNNLMLKMTI